MEKNRGFSHFDAPDAGHGIGNRTDGRYTEVGFYGKGDTDGHHEQSDKIHRDSYF